MSRETLPTSADLDESALHDLIAPELKRWKVPGVEFAVVRKGKPVFAGGFGTPDASSARPVASAPRHYDTWAARYEPLEIDFSVTFLTDAEGDVTEARAGLEETVPPICFARSREDSGVEQRDW